MNKTSIYYILAGVIIGVALATFFHSPTGRYQLANDGQWLIDTASGTVWRIGPGSAGQGRWVKFIKW